MTITEAQDLLNLDDSATAAEIKANYQEAYSKYQIMLTNAPMPNLKKLYQKNLQELEEAFNLLSDSPLQNQADLPTASPIFEESILQDPIDEQRPIKEEYSAQKKTGGGLLLTILWIASVTFLVAGAYAFLRYQEVEKENLELQALENVSATFENQTFRIKNLGSKPVNINIAVVVYRTPDGKFKKYEGLINKAIAPNKTEVIRDSNAGWNGDVLFYTMQVKYNGEDFLLGGHFPTEAKQGILSLTLDSLF